MQTGFEDDVTKTLGEAEDELGRSRRGAGDELRRGCGRGEEELWTR